MRRASSALLGAVELGFQRGRHGWDGLAAGVADTRPDRE